MKKGESIMPPLIFTWGEQASYYNYQAAVEAAGGSIRFSKQIADADGCSGLLLPGGGDLEPWRYGAENIDSRGLEPQRDQAELELLKQFTQTHRPILGICRGMQTINVFFGGTLLQDLPGHTAAAGIDRLHRVSAAPSPMQALWGEDVIVNSAHHQAVDRLGRGLLAAQWTPDGTVEALWHVCLPVLAVQWHPERLRGKFSEMGAADGERLFHAFLNMCR